MKRTEFTDAQILAMVERRATRLGLDVLCHTHGAEGSEAAIRAGVRSIEHGTYLTPAQLAPLLTCLRRTDERGP